jgi:hypothetical protein
MKGVSDLKHSKGMNNAAIDEGGNETTRMPHTDSISVPASDNTPKKHKKNKKK